MSSSIFNSELGKLLVRLILPYLAAMGVFCYFFDGWFSNTVIFSVEDEGPAKIHHFFTANDQEEIPVLGNSRTNNAIDPALISPHSWNYGINGSDSQLLRFLLENELKSDRKSPIVIGIDPDFLLLNQFGDALDYVPMAENKEVWSFLERQGQARDYYKIPTARYFGAFERYLHRFLVKKIGTQSTCTASHGASLCTTRLDPSTKVPVIPDQKKQHENTHFGNAVWLYLSCRAHRDRCFIFAEMPFYRRIYLTDNADSQFIQFKRKICTLPNVLWVQSRDTNPPISYFENFTHLNDVGAQWFTTDISAQIDSAKTCKR